eukprot:TRINITY_DN306_c0_g1_i2.p1 TRINITY_DN306_c0_g1~~TRINITY_DN306_c0_g1_i2.p1  ORF type:complete len:108 (+),score=32.53 TRINITY_DN306_c0_g1_i2:51-374(+)
MLDDPVLHAFDSSYFFFLMIRRPPRSTLSSSSAASDVYKRQVVGRRIVQLVRALGNAQCLVLQGALAIALDISFHVLPDPPWHIECLSDLLAQAVMPADSPQHGVQR